MKSRLQPFLAVEFTRLVDPHSQIRSHVIPSAIKKFSGLEEQRITATISKLVQTLLHEVAACVVILLIIDT